MLLILIGELMKMRVILLLHLNSIRATTLFFSHSIRSVVLLLAEYILFYDDYMQRAIINFIITQHASFIRENSFGKNYDRIFQKHTSFKL